MLKTASNYINVLGALIYKGAWNASTNTPTLASGVGNKGDYYVVSVAGNTNLDGITSWNVGDWAVFNGAVWQKVNGLSAEVVSVNGQTGVVTLGANDVGATANTTYILTSGLLSGGGRLNANATVTLTTVPVANVTGAVPDTRTVSAGGLLSGGGALSSNVTLSLTSVPVANVPGAVPNTVNVIAGTGLTGGGALTANVTLAVGTVPVANVSGLGTMATQNANAVAITGGSVNNVTSSNVTISSGTFVGTNVKVSNGMYSTSTFNGTYTDGIVVDYLTGEGRISVGGADGIGFYQSGVANVSLGNVSPVGIWNLANVSSSNVTITGGTINVRATNIVTNTASTATFGTASLPLVPLGYLNVDLNGTIVKIPYYAV